MVGMGVQYKRVDDFFRLDPYQILLQSFNLFAIFTMLSNVVFNVFAAAPPKMEGCPNSTISFNGSISERCIMWKEQDYCDQPEIIYEFKSVNVEFKSYCGRQEFTWLDTVVQYVGVADKAKFSTTLQMLGVMASCLYAGQLSDMYGRRRTLLLAYASIFILQIVSSFSPSLDTFIISRFLLGLFTGATLTLTPVYIVECLPPAHRFWICTVVTWAPNYLLFSLAAYLTQEWRMLSRVSATVNGIAILLLLLLEESPKFLIQKKRVEDAIKAITRVNRFSRDKASPSTIREIVLHECGDESVALLEKGIEEMEMKKKKKKLKKTYTFYHLYSTKKFAVRTIVVSLSSFILSLVTYSLMFNMNSIGGSTYANMIFSGLLRWVVGATVACLDHFGNNHIGRIRLHMITFGFVTLCLCISFIIFLLGLNHEMEWIIRSLALIAFGTTGCLFLQLSLSISELFPTAIRSLASSHSNVVGRLGNVMSPLVFGLDFFPGLPYLLLSILGAIDVILYFISIPETKGVALPNEMPKRKKKTVLSQL